MNKSERIRMESLAFSYVISYNYSNNKTIKGDNLMYKHYNTNQLILELNLAYDIPKSHEARLISMFVDSIPQAVLLKETDSTGRPAYHPAMLLK